MLKNLENQQEKLIKTAISLAKNLSLIEVTLYIIFILLLLRLPYVIFNFSQTELLLLIIPFMLTLFPLQENENLLITFERLSSNSDKLSSLLSIKSLDWRYKAITHRINPKILIPFFGTFLWRFLSILLALVFTVILEKDVSFSDLYSNNKFFSAQKNQNVEQDNNEQGKANDRRNFENEKTEKSKDITHQEKQEKNQVQSGDGNEGEGKGDGAAQKDGQSQGNNQSNKNRKEKGGENNDSGGEGKSSESKEREDGQNKDNTQRQEQNSERGGRNDTQKQSQSENIGSLTESMVNREKDDGKIGGQDFKKGGRLDIQAGEIKDGEFTEMKEKAEGDKIESKVDDFIPPKRYKRFFE